MNQMRWTVDKSLGAIKCRLERVGFKMFYEGDNKAVFNQFCPEFQSGDND